MGAEYDTSDEGQSRLDQSMDSLRRGFDWAQAVYLQPAYQLLQQCWSSRPIFTTFCVTFGSLSLAPILVFLTFSLAVLGTVVAIGLGAALIVSAHVIAFAALILAISLGFLFFASLGITIFACATLFSYRLLLNVREGGVREGTLKWAQYAREQLTAAPKQHAEDPRTHDAHHVEKPESSNSEHDWTAIAATKCMDGDTNNSAKVIPPSESLGFARDME